MKKGTSTKQLGRFRCVFSREEEEEITKHAKELHERFYGITRESLKELAFQFANQNRIKNPFHNNKAGDAWIKGFMKRNPDLSFRTAESTSSGFNKHQVGNFFHNLCDIIEKYDFKNRPNDIFNMDEFVVHTLAQKPPKVLSGKGKRQVGVISTAEKGHFTSVICCWNAIGTFIPPCFVYMDTTNEKLLDDGPAGAIAWCSDSGYITSEIFTNWINFFIKCVRSNKNLPVLLILDNHISYQNLDTINLARENGVIILSVPPYTTHKLQPLNVAVNKPFKTAFEKAVNNFQKNYPDRRITQFDIAKLVKCACEESATVETATNGFRKCGIFPFNKDIFTEFEFTPSEILLEKQSENQQNTSPPPGPLYVDNTVSPKDTTNNCHFLQATAMYKILKEELKKLQTSSILISLQNKKQKKR